MRNITNKIKLQGIYRKFLLPTVILALTGFVILSTIGYLTLEKTTTADLEEIAELNAKKIQCVIAGKIEKWKSEIQLLASSEKAATMDREKVLDYLKLKKQFLRDYLFFHVSDTLGNYYTTDNRKNNNSNREYFHNVMAGSLTVSDPIISRTTLKKLRILFQKGISSIKSK